MQLMQMNNYSLYKKNVEDTLKDLIDVLDDEGTDE